MSDRQPPIDLRSDTVTRPTGAMRAAIATAAVGDDQFGEDPAINELQIRAAELLGKEAALWMPTGTMSNQVALRTLTRPGDDVIVSRESHAVWHETGAGAANAGVQFTEIGSGGVFTADEFATAFKPRDHIIYPPTTLVQVENTHNRAGGIVFPQDDADAICAEARERSVFTYLDGARLWNAAVASGKTPAELAAPFDLVSVAFSKGLGAPAGSLLAGSEETIIRARRYRRMLGGAMRQVGFLAAACQFGMENHMAQLATDHSNAKVIARHLAESPRVQLDLENVQTNIIVFELTEEAPTAQAVVEEARERGVLIFAFGPRLVRAVTHLDVSTNQCQRAAGILREIIDG